MNDDRDCESTSGALSPYSPCIHVKKIESTASMSFIRVFALSMAVCNLTGITFYLVALLIWMFHGRPDFYIRDMSVVGIAIALVLCIFTSIGLAILLSPILYMLVRKGTDRNFTVRFLLISWSSCAMLSASKVLWEFEHFRLFDSFGQFAFVAVMVISIIVAAITARRAG